MVEKQKTNEGKTREHLRILLVQPASASSRTLGRKLAHKLNIYPSLTLEQLAGITSKTHEIAVIDERFRKIDFTWNGDIVGIPCMTPEAPRAYEIADEFRRRGKTVILGGWHPSAIPEEAKRHADSVVIGEAEITWPKLLGDYTQGTLQPYYRNEKPVDLTHLPSADRSIRTNIMFTAAIQATRGCPVGCEFCGVSNSSYGRIHRKRCIENVVEEIRSIKERYLFFYDPSFTINPAYTKELFHAMNGLHKRFICFANIDVLGRDEELLRLARDAGCQQWFIGFESISQPTIDALGKRTNTVEEYTTTIKKIHDYGMTIIGGFIFGFDTDTSDVFEQTKNRVYEMDVDAPEFTILTPYPGTPLFTRLEREGRIITRDWSKYTEKGNVVFQPKHMSPEELLKGAQRVTREFNSFSGMMRHILQNKQFVLQRIVSNILQYV